MPRSRAHCPLHGAGSTIPANPRYADCANYPGCRDKTGTLVVKNDTFPHGMKAVADYIHSKGLKFGVWFGHTMCARSNDVAAGPDYAKLDAELFAGWGVDAVKHDNCVNVDSSPAGIAANYARYRRLGQALNATG